MVLSPARAAHLVTMRQLQAPRSASSALPASSRTVPAPTRAEHSRLAPLASTSSSRQTWLVPRTASAQRSPSAGPLHSSTPHPPHLQIVSARFTAHVVLGSTRARRQRPSRIAAARTTRTASAASSGKQRHPARTTIANVHGCLSATTSLSVKAHNTSRGHQHLRVIASAALFHIAVLAARRAPRRRQLLIVFAKVAQLVGTSRMRVTRLVIRATRGLTSQHEGRHAA